MRKTVDQILTVNEVARVLNIKAYTVETLADSGRIPCTTVPGSSGGGKTIRVFDARSIVNWLEHGAPAETAPAVTRLKETCRSRFSETLTALGGIDAQIAAPRVPKGYSLSRVKNKRFGFIYYVRYVERGKIIPTRWSTHTNNRELAEQFAVNNRDQLLADRGERQEQKKISAQLRRIVSGYYAKDSPFLDIDAKRGRRLGERGRQVYHNFMVKKLLPYLEATDTTNLKAITTPFLARFQNHLLRSGLRPQTINHGLSYVRKMFDHLLIEGYCETNPCASLKSLTVSEEDLTFRGCYDLSELRGVFNRRWDDGLSYLLCLLIYSTNMRNCEIGRIQVSDLITINGITFVSIPRSKTRNGERIVPIHPFVRRKLLRYIGKQRLKPDDYLFSGSGKVQSAVWTKAYHDMGAVLKYDAARLTAEHITFYSGRHFWKTMTNAEELGDAEEYFMGHRVSEDVARRYNHRDKQGQEKIAEKARKVFTILDKRLFTHAAVQETDKKPLTT